MKSSLPKTSEIGQQVYLTLGKYLRLDPTNLHPEDSLRDDLGLDSLQTIELVYEVESAFDLQIPDEDFGRLTTIGDVVLYLNERTGPADTSPSTPQATPSAKQTSRPATKTKNSTHSKKRHT
ncbi:MAG: phosphopantetheine-binding protein [Nitrospirota bacterium]|jgi:acyl carrier protein|nr:phosphopantetheine-binding protein [Nitrospirota bacterium]MDH4360623.1 phosphopantetheine-binding protein [Nitrospirota bacterium]